MFTKKSFLVKVEKAALKTKSEHSNSNTLLFIRGLGGSSLLLAAALLLLLSLPAFAQDDPDVLWVKELGVQINRVKFSPDSRYLAVAADYRNPKLFDVETGDSIREFEQPNYTNCVDFNSDGSIIAVAGGNFYYYDGSYKNNSAYLFETETGKLVKTFTIDEDSVSFKSIDISPSSKYLAVVARIGQLKCKICIWDLGTDEIAYQSTDTEYGKIKFSPDEEHFVVSTFYQNGSNSPIHIFNTNPMKYEGILGTHDYAIRDICFSHDGKYLASAGGPVKIWDFEKRELKQTITKKDTCFRSIAYSIDDRYLVIGISAYRDVFVYDILNEIITYQYNNIITSAKSLDVSKNNKYIGAGKYDICAVVKARWEPSSINDDSIVDSTFYPNPTNGTINIEVNCSSTNQYYEIINNNGTILLEDLIDSSSLTINLSLYPNGIYFIRLICGGNVTTYKVVKEG